MTDDRISDRTDDRADGRAGAPALQADVVVVGAGTAGLHAAACLARGGRRVVVIERRPEGQGGARWCNAVVEWQFRRAGLAFPKPPELRSGSGRRMMISPSGDHRIVIDSNPMCETDMRALTARLAENATAAGVEILWGVTDVVVRRQGGRVVGVEANRGGAPITVDAALTVDASGRRAVVRHQVPELDGRIGEVEGPDLCSAQQLVVDIADRDAALAFVESYGLGPGEGVTFMAPSGGYSIKSLLVEESLEEASLLTGTIADGAHGSGPDLMAELRAEYPWLGAQRFGGGGLIPLRRVSSVLGAPGVALVGDAAFQVMPAHGSGIGFGLMAGAVLAEAVDGAADPGSAAAVWRYQASFLREFGASLATFDLFRRMSVRLGSDGVEELIASGIFDAEMVAPGLEQRLVDPPISHLLVRAGRLVRHPRIARALVPTLVRATGARLLYRFVPTTPSVAALSRWQRAERWLLGGVPAA